MVNPPERKRLQEIQFDSRPLGQLERLRVNVAKLKAIDILSRARDDTSQLGGSILSARFKGYSGTSSVDPEIYTTTTRMN